MILTERQVDSTYSSTSDCNYSSAWFLVNQAKEPGSRPALGVIDFAESCGCFFRTGGICYSAQQPPSQRHNHCGYGHSGPSIRLCSPFPAPMHAGCPAFGGCRCTRHRRIPESGGSDLPAGSLLLLYSSRLPPCRICFSGKHRLYKVSILLLLHSLRLCNHYITNQNADPPSLGFHPTIYGNLAVFAIAKFFSVKTCLTIDH